MKRILSSPARLLLLGLLPTVSSCFVAQPFEAPDAEKTSAEYRRPAPSPAADTLSAAQLPWDSVFQDSLLRTYLDTALRRNFEQQIALATLAKNRAYWQQSRQAFWPQMGLNAQQNHQELSSNSQFGGFFDRIDQYELSGNISWEADIWGRLTSQKRAARAGYLASQEAQRALQTQIIAQVARTYYQLAALAEQETIARQSVRLRKKALRTSRALQQAGRLSAPAVAQARAQWLEAKALVANTGARYRQTETAFQLLLGQAPQSVATRKLSTLAVSHGLSTGVPLNLLQNRPDVRAAEQTLRQRFQLVNVARSAFYPRLTITANAGFQSLDFSTLISPQSIFLNLVSGLAQPLFQRGQLQAQLTAARADQQVALLNFQKSLVTASGEVADALTEMATADSLLAYRRAQVQAYRQAVRQTEQLLQRGEANYLEVLSARENFLNARLQVIALRLRYLEGRTRLYRALGGGWRAGS